MKLKKLKANQTEIHLDNGAVVFFSYNTLVAAQLEQGGFVKTDKKWSTTTSKHINQWLAGANAKPVPQSELDKMVG